MRVCAVDAVYNEFNTVFQMRDLDDIQPNYNICKTNYIVVSLNWFHRRISRLCGMIMWSCALNNTVDTTFRKKGSLHCILPLCHTERSVCSYTAVVAIVVLEALRMHT